MGSTHIEQHWGADNSSSFKSMISSTKLTLCNVASHITNPISKDTTRPICTKLKGQDHHSQMSYVHTHVHILTYACIYVYMYILCMYGRYTHMHRVYLILTVHSHTVLIPPQTTSTRVHILVYTQPHTWYTHTSRYVHVHLLGKIHSICMHTNGKYTH